MQPTKGYAAQSKSAPLTPFNFERREVGDHDVQIEILYCGVCHSDIHTARGEWAGTVFPCVPGHEIVGKIVKVGAHVKKYKAGDLAGVGCMVDSCHECDNCKEGLEQFCDKGATFTYNSKDKHTDSVTYGGYSDKVIVDESFVLKVSEQLPLQNVAPLLCAGITTYSPLKHWKVGKGHRVGVIGLGGLGHMAVKFAVSFGAEVTMISTSPSKEQDAKKLGAHKFLLTTDKEQLKNYNKYFDFLIDTVSAPHDYAMYGNLLRTNGVHICVGMPPEPFPFHPGYLVSQRRSVAGSLIGGIPETQEMLDYCAEHNIVSDVEVIPMNKINEAYERMIKGDVRYRFVIDMSTL